MAVAYRSVPPATARSDRGGSVVTVVVVLGTLVVGAVSATVVSEPTAGHR